MRLNLGCGRAQLPTSADNTFTQHLTYLPPTALDPNERWINVDRVKLDGVDEIVDLFAYPWMRSSNGNPWNDDSIDEIWASNLVEHIPHEARYAILSTTTHRQQGALDGWYAWFYEAWRILKPDGLLHVVAPAAFSIEGMGDPTHTRYIVPSTFSYLLPNDEAPFDYQIAARFAAVDNVWISTNVAWKMLIDKGAVSQDQLGAYAELYNNVYKELYVCLRAVK